MTSDLARAVKGSSGFLSGSDPCKDPGHSVLPITRGLEAGSFWHPASASERTRSAKTIK